MKKVLALVLAVIMVCTMAMAVAVSPVEYATSTTTTTTGVGYMQAKPGQAIILDEETDLRFTGDNVYKDKDGNFVPEKNKVTVSFEKGAEFIASQGWAKTTDGYKYVLVLKENDTAIVDGKADIIISKIVTSVYGKKATTTIKLSEKAAAGMSYAVEADSVTNPTLPGSNFAYIGGMTGYNFVAVFDYGWSDGGKVEAGTTPTPAVENVYTVIKNATDNTKKAWEWTNSIASRNFKIGEKVLFNEVPNNALSTKVTDEVYDKDVTYSTVLAAGVVVPSSSVTLTVESQPEGSKLYMVKADGSLIDLGAKFNENGVLVATAKVTGPVIVADKALTAAAAPATTGTTTNPGTGANDVVGVAAALAVVALVSGAAISLKK